MIQRFDLHLPSGLLEVSVQQHVGVGLGQVVVSRLKVGAVHNQLGDPSIRILHAQKIITSSGL